VNVEAEELAVWTRAWAISRGCAPPAPAFGGWFVHVGQPDQVSRYVFPALNPVRLRALSQAIREPYVLLKLPFLAAQVQAALAPGWDAVRTGWFMRIDLSAAEPDLPEGFEVVVEPGACSQYRLRDASGSEAARARLTILGSFAVIDSVDTEPAFRRRGLASALMQRLVADAHAQGATVGLLVATDAGLKVYERLGWTLLAPWTTAQLNP
jgi:GNAT superfamily N-acetyltransferase